MLKIKLFLIVILIIFLIGCNNSKDADVIQKIDYEIKYQKDKDKAEITNEVLENKEDFIKLKENIGDRSYGIKKETLTISDTSHKNMTFKINYPYFYTIYENKIFYEDSITDDLLKSIQKDIFNDYAINNFGVEVSQGKDNDTFDYEIIYQDDNFLSISYSGVIQEYGTMQFSHPFYLTKNIYIENNGSYFSIKEVTLDEILSITEIENYLNKNKKKLFEFFGDEELEEISEYFSDINLKFFELKENNKINVVINLPRRLGSYAIFEMEYNWKEKLLNKYKNK